MMDAKPLLRAACLGCAAGIRSLTPLACVSWAVATGRWRIRTKPFGLLGHPSVEAACLLAAGAEILGDKLPSTPPRTRLPPYLFRVAMGGALGVASLRVEEQSGPLGGLLGASVAAASTYGSYRLRMLLTRRGLANPLAGVLGDIVSMCLSLAVTARERRNEKKRWSRAIGWLTSQR